MVHVLIGAVLCLQVAYVSGNTYVRIKTVTGTESKT